MRQKTPIIPRKRPSRSVTKYHQTNMRQAKATTDNELPAQLATALVMPNGTSIINNLSAIRKQGSRAQLRPNEKHCSAQTRPETYWCNKTKPGNNNRNTSIRLNQCGSSHLNAAVHKLRTMPASWHTTLAISIQDLRRTLIHPHTRLRDKG